MGQTAFNPAAGKLYNSDEERWNAVVLRDRQADGRFFYSVKSTGIYCRPSCGSRLALRENVRFHATALEAENAGFRPCKRCRPNRRTLTERDASVVTNACKVIETTDKIPTLAELARSAGLSAFHFQRLFLKKTGLTPKEYALAHRAERVRKALSKKRSVTEAFYEAGYNSSGRFYAESQTVLGMAPKRYQTGGSGLTIRFAVGECSLGTIVVASTDIGVCAILLGDAPDPLLKDLQDRFPNAELVGGDVSYEDIVAKVIGFIEQPQLGLGLPLDIRGTAFQQRVWKALRNIPPGRTVTYTELAERIKMPKAVRAVANACAANTLAVAIPCHRVVRTDGSLSGYRWGVERKRALLLKEGQDGTGARKITNR